MYRHNYTYIGAAREYSYGIQTQSRKGEIFQIPVEPIIDVPSYEMFIKLRERNKTYPANGLKHDYLLGGHLKCAKSVRSRRADEQAWKKICEAVNNPEYLMTRARDLVDHIRKNAENVHEEEKRIRRQLEALSTERQWVITQARQGAITSADMKGQLSTMTMQEVNLKADLASLGKAIDTNMLDNWKTKS